MPAPEVGKQGSEIELIYFVKIQSVWNFYLVFLVSMNIAPAIIQLMIWKCINWWSTLWWLDGITDNHADDDNGDDDVH